MDSEGFKMKTTMKYKYAVQDNKYQNFVLDYFERYVNQLTSENKLR